MPEHCSRTVSHRYGVPKLLRPLIFSRTSLYRSVFRFTMRLLCVPLVCFLSFLQFAQAAPLQVSIVLSEEGGAYQAFSDSLRKKLPSEDFQVRVLRIDDPLGKSDLYVAVGIKAASRLASSATP